MVNMYQENLSSITFMKLGSSLIGWTIEAFMLIIIFANVELTQFLNLSFHLLIHADGFKGKA